MIQYCVSLFCQSAPPELLIKFSPKIEVALERDFHPVLQKVQSREIYSLNFCQSFKIILSEGLFYSITCQGGN